MNIQEHLIKRHIDLELHQPVLDFQNCAATFLCWNFAGGLTGYQRYRPFGDRKIFNDPNLGRYYTYRNKDYPTVTVWGLESYYVSDGPIFITEGIFDAARLTERKQSAFATLCNAPPKDYKNWFQMLNRPVIAICDNDKAGLKLADYADSFEVVPKGDLGDAPDDYVSFLIEKYANFQTVH